MKVIWFIGLKIAEVLGIIFIPYYLGMWVHSWTEFFCLHHATPPSCAPLWIIGFLILFLSSLAIMIVAGIALFGMLNWSWATMLQDRFRKLES